MDIVFIEAHEAIYSWKIYFKSQSSPIKRKYFTKKYFKRKRNTFPIREIADLIIDTTEIKNVELEKRFKKIFIWER